MAKREYVYTCKVGAVKTYYVQEKDGRQFIGATKRGTIIRELEAKNIHEARMIYWRQLKQLA